MHLEHHDHIHVALAKTQETIHIKHDPSRSGKNGYRNVKETEVVVDRQTLKDYLEEYHHRHSTGRCKADGQDWPCDTYTVLRKAVDE